MRYWPGMALVAIATAIGGGRAVAQSGSPPSPPPSPSAAHAREMAQVQQATDLLFKTSLSEEKTAFRDQMLALRDTLTRIQSTTVRMQRASAGGMHAVVQSNGRWLGRYCASGIASAEQSLQQAAGFDTHSVRGDKLLADFRSSLVTLRDKLRECEHADSVLAQAKQPGDEAFIEVGRNASRAIVEFSTVRDGFLTMLGVSLLP